MTKKSEELEESISILLNEEDIKDSVKSEGSEEDTDKQSLSRLKSLRYGQDTKYRKVLSQWVMSVVTVWLFLVVAITTLSGFKFFHLDGSVLITLLATTTVNILGLAYIVLRGLFLPIKNL